MLCNGRKGNLYFEFRSLKFTHCQNFFHKTIAGLNNFKKITFMQQLKLLKEKNKTFGKIKYTKTFPKEQQKKREISFK